MSDVNKVVTMVSGELKDITPQESIPIIYDVRYKDFNGELYGSYTSLDEAISIADSIPGYCVVEHISGGIVHKGVIEASETALIPGNRIRLNEEQLYLDSTLRKKGKITSGTFTIEKHNLQYHSVAILDNKTKHRVGYIMR